MRPCTPLHSKTAVSLFMAASIDLWRHAVDREHGGATTRWPSPATERDDDDEA